MKNLILILLTFTNILMNSYSQTSFCSKIELGFLIYQNNIIEIDPVPGSNWKGYNLNEEQNGLDINIVKGLTLFKERIFTGIGIGYENFEGINGIAVFGDIEYLFLKSRFTPLFNFKIGYNHIWNQYEGGKGTGLSEYIVGLNYKLTSKRSIYLKSGIIFSQQSSFLPIRLGIRF